jgi:hypothetical protein
MRKVLGDFFWNTDDADWADKHRFFVSFCSLGMVADARRFVCGSAAIFWFALLAFFMEHR